MGFQFLQFINCLVNCKNMEKQHKLTPKKPKFSSFSWIRRNWEVQLEQNLEISLLTGKNLEVQPNTNTQKFPILNLRINWNVLPKQAICEMKALQVYKLTFNNDFMMNKELNFSVTRINLGMYLSVGGWTFFKSKLLKSRCKNELPRVDI